ncbi:hypothetical protein [Halobacillus karajensis]|nr:hypothetical protein [Halobacillus karajensis]
MGKRKCGQKWYLLFRLEEGQGVHLYTPLRKDELRARKRQGWKVKQI